MAQQQKQFTLEDLNFGGTRYHEMSPTKQYYAWWGDRLMHLNIDEISCVDNITCAEDKQLLFSLDDIEKALKGEKYVFGINLLNTKFPYADKTLALINIPNRRVLYDFEAKNIIWEQETTGTLEWNAESRTDAFSRDNNLWLRLHDGKERQLTRDGSREIVYGRSVHRNEFGITKGTFFSPDGKKLAFYRMDQTMVADYPQVNTFEREATYEPDKYPMAGMTSHEVTIGVYDIDTEKLIYLNAGMPKDRYFTNIQWAPNGQSIYLFELNREQNHCTLDEYSASIGEKIRTLYVETDEKYVEPLHPITFLPWDENKFLLWSQKDGYMHLYLFDAKTGKQIRQLTQGEYVTLDLLGFCKKTKNVIITANKENHLQTNIYAVDINSGKMMLLDNGKGVHEGVINESGTGIVERRQEPDVPGTYSLLSTTKRDIKELYAADDPWQGYAIPHYNTGTIKADDGVTELHWRMVLPPDFDSAKKYPTIIYVYGGPHAHLVAASWHWTSRSWETYMAQKGYIIYVLDSRGSENRGKDFEQVTFCQLGQVEMKDQMKGVEYLRTLPYIDTERMGVHGWSYGGFMTLSLMTNYPDVFKVGVAGGPVTDWKWYEVMYGERYMDTPETNAEGYEKTSLISMAKNLKGRLQIIIGMNDPVVVPQHALQFINACNENGTYPDFYVYPGEEHNMQGHMSVHLHERITRYFEDFLK